MRVSSINCLCCPTSQKTKLQNINSRVNTPHQEEVLFKGKAQRAGIGIFGTLGVLAGCMLGPVGAIVAGSIGALGGGILGSVDDAINENNNNDDDDDTPPEGNNG